MDTGGKPGTGTWFSGPSLPLQPIPRRNQVQHVHLAVVVQIGLAGGGGGCGIAAEAVADEDEVEDVCLAIVVHVAGQVLVETVAPTVAGSSGLRLVSVIPLSFT